jgi:hypothetical protein
MLMIYSYDELVNSPLSDDERANDGTVTFSLQDLYFVHYRSDRIVLHLPTT